MRTTREQKQRTQRTRYVENVKGSGDEGVFIPTNEPELQRSAVNLDHQTSICLTLVPRRLMCLCYKLYLNLTLLDAKLRSKSPFMGNSRSGSSSLSQLSATSLVSCPKRRSTIVSASNAWIPGLCKLVVSNSERETGYLSRLGATSQRRDLCI